VLPTTIESGFEQALWEKFPELNGEGYPAAELEIKPYTHGDVAEIQERFGICRRCDGMGTIDAEPTPAEKAAGAKPHKDPCPVCGGKQTGKSGLDLDVRLAIGLKVIRGGRGLVGQDPQTGEVRPLVWSEKMRDGLCHTLANFFLIVGRAQTLGAMQDAAKKDSSTPPPADSPTVPAPAGVEG
jgi:hypothetical protein